MQARNRTRLDSLRGPRRSAGSPMTAAVVTSALLLHTPVHAAPPGAGWPPTVTEKVARANRARSIAYRPALELITSFAINWNLVPAATPPAVVNRLATELTRIIRLPEVRERLVSQGAEVYTMTPPEFAAFFERERKNWAAVVAAGGVKID